MKKAAAVFTAVIIASLTAYAENIHEVRKGDTLWDLSDEYYGDSWQWPVIWFGNVKLNNPDLIFPKEKLLIPGFSSEGEIIKIEKDELFKIEAGNADTGNAVSAFESADGSNSFRSDRLNGFDVALEEIPPFSVLSVEEERAMAGIGAEIVVSGGREQRLDNGDTLIIYEERGRLEKNRNIYTCVAYARISKVGDNTSTAVIYKAFSSVSRGFRAEKGREVTFSRPQGYRNVNSDLTGEILYLSENHSLSAAGYTAISDIGRTLPVKEGDKFEIIRTVTEHGVVKSHVVGEGQLILLNDRFSTIYFVSTEKEIRKGDKLRLHKVAVF